MTNRLCRNGGNFVIASGRFATFLSGKRKLNYQFNYNGTAVRLNLNVNQIGSLEKRIGEFREDAKKIVKQINGSSGRPPSAMSLLLRRDYT